MHLYLKKVLMKFLFPALSFVLLAHYSFSQKDIGLNYAETITNEGLQKQLTIIASAEMEGRETGTEGQRKAAAYIQNQFRQIGLTSPPTIINYQQNYPLNRDTLIPKTFKIGNHKYDFGKDYIVTPGSSDENEFKSKTIIFAGYGIAAKNYDDYAGKDVKDKLAVIFTGEPKVSGRYLVSDSTIPSSWGSGISRKAQLAKEKGAKALIVINLAIDTITSLLAENSKTSDIYFPSEKKADDKKVPVINIVPAVVTHFFGVNESAEIIEAAKGSNPLKDFTIEKNIKSKLAYRKIKIPSTASNVIGFVEGSDKKNEFVFLTAHYDHLGKKGDVIYYGADDDGSGTAGVIEMARAFAKAKADGFGLRRTVVFMTVSGEEEGLWGSEYYSDNPLFSLDSTTVDLNTDMIGRIDPERKKGDSTNYVYVIGDDKISSDLMPISKGVNKRYTNLELDYKFNDVDDPQKIYYRSDHYNFARKGVPIIFFFDGIHNDYHKPTDTVDKINFDTMEKRARFIFLTAWEIANMDRMLKRDLPLPTEER